MALHIISSHGGTIIPLTYVYETWWRLDPPPGPVHSLYVSCHFANLGDDPLYCTWFMPKGFIACYFISSLPSLMFLTALTFPFPCCAFHSVSPTFYIIRTHTCMPYSLVEHTSQCIHHVSFHLIIDAQYPIITDGKRFTFCFS